MEMTSGARLGPYEIVSRLGAGGMGEVWRARDTRLDRSVAIKILPAKFAADVQARLRFEREAKAISQLNHPNICTLHDIGDGYLVMELLEGETLAARVGRGPMAPADVFRYGAQIADALHRAHRAGIVHRDLKPANIMLAKSGAKLLDFGLAKSDGTDVNADATTMHAKALTDRGVVVGTVQYMAPEQLEGAQADARTDIFALGAVLYEMATGRRAFDGSTRTSVIAAIVSGHPAPISSIVPLVPRALEHLVQKCMEKDPDDRWQSAHDVAEQLRWLAAPSGAVDAVAQRRPRRVSRWLVAAAIAGAALGGALVDRFALRRAPRVPLMRYVSFSGNDTQPAVSPDGKSIAFASLRDGRPRIWIKQLNGGGEIAITDGPDADPRFSPDGTSVLFSRGAPPNTIYRVAALGGDARKVIDNGSNGEWSPDGTKIAFVRVLTENGTASQNIFIADADGGNERRVYSSTVYFLTAARFSPDGSTLAVSARSGMTSSAGVIALIDLASGRTRSIPVSGSATSAVWVDDDVLAYGNVHSVTTAEAAGGEIVRRDLRSGREEVLLSLPSLGLFIDRIGGDGLIVETPSRRVNMRGHLLSSGVTTWLTRGNSQDRQPAFSRDGEWLVFSSDRSGNLDLWAISRRNGTVRRITDHPGSDWDPHFTPDRKHILWSSSRTGHFEIWRADVDGSAPRRISNDGVDAQNPTQGPHGDVFYASGHPQKRGLWRIRRDGTAVQLVRGTITHPEASPDGEYVAYHTRAATEEALHVVRVRDGKVMTFASGFGTTGFISVGRSRWMPDGKAIVFVGAKNDAYGLFIQDFTFDRDTSATRRPFAGFDPATPTESFGIDPNGTVVVTSAVDDLNALTLIESLSLR